MRDISPKVLPIYETALSATSVPCPRTRVALAECAQGPRALSWDAFTDLNEALLDEIGEAAMVRVGHLVIDSIAPNWPQLSLLYRGATSLRTVYRISHRYGGPSMFPSVEPWIEREDATELVLGTRLPSSMRPNRGFFLIIQGVLEATPRIQGLADLPVSIELRERECLYTIPVPRRSGLLTRIRQAVAQLFVGTRASATELESARVRLLIDQQDQLRAGLAEEARLRHEADEARQVAESALATQARFLAMMTHELRTPLYGVLGAIEIARDGQHSTLEDPLEVAVASGTHLLTLLDDLLSFSRMDAEPLGLALSPESTLHFADHLTLLYRRRFIEQQTSLSVSVDGDAPRWVRADAARLTQVLAILLDNALKFATQGDVQVTFSRAGESLRVRVDDSGIGVPTDMRERIFEPFRQADDSIRREFGGTGLGLTVAKRLIDAHGHHITCDTSPLGGAAFEFTLDPAEPPSQPSTDPRLQRTLVHVGPVPCPAHVPENLRGLATLTVADCRTALSWLQPNSQPAATLVTADLSDDPALAALCRHTLVHRLQHASPAELPLYSSLTLDPTEDHPAPRRQRDLKVLVAEDHPISRKIVAAQLTRLGCTVTTAEDGEVALDRGSTASFDLILMDLHMPRLDGESATRRLRQRHLKSKTSSPPIFAFTADPKRVSDGDTQYSLFDGVLSKPCTREELEAVLSSLSPSVPPT